MNYCHNLNYYCNLMFSKKVEFNHCYDLNYFYDLNRKQSFLIIHPFSKWPLLLQNADLHKSVFFSQKISSARLSFSNLKEKAHCGCKNVNSWAPVSQRSYRRQSCDKEGTNNISSVSTKSVRQKYKKQYLKRKKNKSQVKVHIYAFFHCWKPEV